MQLQITHEFDGHVARRGSKFGTKLPVEMVIFVPGELGRRVSIVYMPCAFAGELTKAAPLRQIFARAAITIAVTTARALAVRRKG